MVAVPFNLFNLLTSPLDTTPPVITLLGDNPFEIVDAGIGTYLEPGASALDAVDGVRTVTIGSPVGTSTPGTYTVTYTATDLSGNTATKVRTVTFVFSI